MLCQLKRYSKKMQGSLFLDVVCMYLNKQAKTINPNPTISLLFYS